MQKLILMVTLFVLAGCNPGDNAKGGYREKQEEATTPNDYTRGTDSRTPAETKR
jgi:hypothetical protein